MILAKLMATPLARLIRGALGLVVLMIGQQVGGSWGGIALALLGAALFTMAFLNICLIGPLLRAPFDWGNTSPRSCLGTAESRRAYLAARR